MRGLPTSDPLTVLLEHNHWATRRVLDFCRRVTPEQFHQRFEIGHGTLHDTLLHLIACMRSWADYTAGRAVRPSMEPPGPCFTVEELSRLLDDASDDLRGLIEQSRDKLAEPIYATLGGTRCTFTRGVALTHALVHGTHHRAQCLNMLRHLNVPGVSDDLPDLDVNDWQYETETKS
ncbi:MAG: DinB family protein [Tepidisphaeraceae bacterium]